MYPRICTLLVALTLCACAGNPSAEEGARDLAGQPVDPLESVNRKVFAFNEFVDKYAGKPVAKGYRKVTPGWMDDAITRFFQNLKDLRSSVNGVLQWEWSKAGNNFGRFTVNSTLGVAGFFDVATDVGLDKTPEDFGLTLAKWGAEAGPYLVLPLLGPSTTRAAAGQVPDYWLWGPNYIESEGVEYAVDAVYVIDMRADLLDFERAIVGDKYTFIRDSYLQNRRYKAGEAPVKDDFGEGFDSSGEDGW